MQTANCNLSPIILYIYKTEVLFLIREMWNTTVRGMIPGPLNFGPRPYGTVHDPMPIGPLAFVWTPSKAQSEPKSHNEST